MQLCFYNYYNTVLSIDWYDYDARTGVTLRRRYDANPTVSNKICFEAVIDFSTTLRCSSTTRLSFVSTYGTVPTMYVTYVSLMVVGRWNGTRVQVMVKQS